MLVGTKGRGTNMANLITACLSGDVPAEPGLVVAPKAGTPAVLRAEALGVPTAIVPRGDDYAERLLAELRAARTTLVCLAGLMFLLPPEVLRAYPGRVLNIHPALLPKHGGKGMYGHHVHEAVLAAGDSESGCSIHLVSEAYDEGPVVFQMRCPVLPGDTPDSLADRVLDLEHIAYPMALKHLLAHDE